MKYSELFGKTSKQVPKDETSVNAKLLIRAGFIRKELAGVYNFLPLGLRILDKISQIVREEMDAAGGQEVLLSSLQAKENWEKTGRWKSFDVLFRVKSQWQAEYALGPTHEEVLVPLVGDFVFSYRDLPLYLYQIQTKFRDEPRAKAGLLRGREFLMKDLYSFHTDEEDMMRYYDVMRDAYKKVFERCGLSAIETKAGGGTFSQFSHEYQVLCVSGEDEIIYCDKRNFAENIGITKYKQGDKCPKCGANLEVVKTIEVGNIFPLKDKFSKAFNLTYKNKEGKEQLVIMGCYGLGITRTMGAIVEVFHDDAGIIWPQQVAPFEVHLLTIDKGQEVYEKLTKANVEVLWDDREDVSAGEKFADADLIGIPIRLVVSKKTGKDRVEWRERAKAETKVISFEEVVKKL